MKKFFAVLLAFACIIMPGTAKQFGKVSANGFIMESDAQTAMEKNQAAILDALENTTFTNDLTRDEFQSFLMEKCIYSADKKYGASFEMQDYRFVPATQNKSGYVKAVIILSQNDGETGFEVKAVIPSLSGNTIDEEQISQEEKDTEDSRVPTAEEKAKLRAAQDAISKAIWDFPVSNNTTKADMLKMARSAIPDKDAVTVSLEDYDFSLTPSTTSVNGTVVATYTLTCGAASVRHSAAKTIEPYETAESSALENDRHAISRALKSMNYSNKVTKDSILATAGSVIRNGSTVKWKDGFSKKEATFKEAGNIFGYLEISNGSETREMLIQEAIPMLVRKLPSNQLSVNKTEWDIMRMVNVERYNAGAPLLSMIGALQDPCDVRETELVESFSHTRPNGETCFTAITNFSYTTAGENIYQSHCPNRATPIYTEIDSERAMEAWMNSPGHRANILKPAYTYAGIGAHDGMGTATAVQLFGADQSYVTKAESSSGSLNFEDEEAMQKEYLILTLSTGTVAYMPLDVSYMQKNGNEYTITPANGKAITLTVNGGAPGTASVFSDVSPKAYYAEAINWAVGKSITAGTSSTMFSPDNTCTRAQIITFLWRAVGSPKSSAKNPFTDVSQNDYYYYAAVWANEKGMVSGSKFEGDTPCTRSSTVTYLWKNAGSPSFAAANTFSDVSSSSEYAQAVSWAVKNSVTSGTSETTFSPDAICSRAQIVTFLKRAIG